MSMNFKPYIIRDSSICGGEPVITGTRITVRAVVVFAAVSAEEGLPLSATPALA